MKQVILLLIVIIIAADSLSAQHIDPFFNTIGSITEEIKPIKLDSINETVPKNGSSFSISNDDASQGVGQLAAYYNRCETEEDTREGSDTGKRLHYYTGTRHELTMENLLSFLEESGLSNRLYVLAQAVLETGNFNSNVCLDYNNLFGLFDSAANSYYRFESWEDSVIGYKRFIQDKYNGGSYLEFLDNLGYAEDPDYIRKVAELAVQIYKDICSGK